MPERRVPPPAPRLWGPGKLSHHEEKANDAIKPLAATSLNTQKQGPGKASAAVTGQKRKMAFAPQLPNNPAALNANAAVKNSRQKTAPPPARPRPKEMFLKSGPSAPAASLNFSLNRPQVDMASLMRYKNQTDGVPQRRPLAPPAPLGPVDETGWGLSLRGRDADASTAGRKPVRPPVRSSPQNVPSSTEDQPLAGQLDVQNKLFSYGALESQWIHLNSLLEEAMDKQRRSAEDQLGKGAVAVSNLYTQVGDLKQQVRNHQLVKIVDSVLQAQVPALEEWSKVQDDVHSSVSSLVDALTACLTSVPLDELGVGVPSANFEVEQFKASLQDAEEVLNSLQTTIKSIPWLVRENKGAQPSSQSMCDTGVPKDCNGLDSSSGLDRATKEAQDLLQTLEAEASYVEECWELLERLQKKELRVNSLRCQIIQIGRAGNRCS